MDTLVDLPVVPAHALALLRPDEPLPPWSPGWQPHDLRGLAECIPKAVSADHANNEALLSTTDGGDHMAQEKLNGVFVMYDGRDMYTKQGRRIVAPHFTEWLPPGFPLVGELYLGNGHLPFAHTVALASNALPDFPTLPVGTTAAERPLLWRQARLVAFDVPGLEPVADWPYRRRYALLLSVVAAWSRRKREAAPTPAMLPLQVIRQYPMSAVPDLFREVVEGTVAPNERRFPAFGVPEAVTVARRGDLGGGAALIAARVGAWRAPGETAPAFVPDDPVVPGEGLMLYRQSAEWVPRGADGHAGGDAVYKFKPTIVTVGVTLATPPCGGRPARPGDGDGDGDGDGTGGRRTVRIAWWDPWLGSQGRERVYLAPGRRPEDFTEGTRVFFTFVFYDEGPRFTRALGPRLSAEHRARLRRPWPGTPADADGDPDRWPPGAVRALFPVHFHWDPRRFGAGLSRRDHAARNTPSPFVRPATGFHGGGGTVARNLRDVRATAAAHIARETAAARAGLRHSHAAWLRAPGTLLARSLVCACFVLRAWADRTGRPPFAAEWWTEDAGRGARPYAHWGPFRLRPLAAAAAAADPRLRWVHGMVRVLLTVLASVWFRIGSSFGAEPLRGLSAPEGAAHLNALGATVGAMIAGELGPRWDAWRDRLMPTESGADLFGGFYAGVPNLAWFARCVLLDPFLPDDARGGWRAPPSPPWDAMWGAGAGVDADVDVDAGELHRTFADRSSPDTADRAAAYRTLRDQHRGHWRAAPDAVLLHPDTAIPVAVSDLAERVAARAAREGAGASAAVDDPWVSLRSAAVRRLGASGV